VGKVLKSNSPDPYPTEWLADLLRHGRLASQFYSTAADPCPARSDSLSQVAGGAADRKRINRIHNVLETANIQLGAVASNVVGASGRQMLHALERGESDPEVLAELAKGR